MMARVWVTIAALLALVTSATAAGRVVTLTAADGTPLSGTFYESTQPPSPFDSHAPALAQGSPERSRGAPGVVLVHMLGRQRDDWALVAERLQQQGLAALTIDLRGHGGSGGTSTPLPRMALDVRAAVEWLASRSGIRANAIGIAGASVAAAFAVQTAIEQPGVRSLVLLSPSLDYRGVRLDQAMIKKYGARPMLLIASSDDPYALRTVRDLVADTSGVREQRLASVAAHGTKLLTADPDLTTALVDWFRRTLVF